jgi:hypothetical protein
MVANMQKAMPTPQEMQAQQQARMQANKAKRQATPKSAAKAAPAPAAPGTIAGVNPSDPFAGNGGNFGGGGAGSNWEESIQRESVSFQNNELSRIVSLVQYR